MSADDLAVPSTEVLYRRIASHGDANMMVVDESTGHRQLSSGAFVSGRGRRSIYLSTILAAIALGPADLARDPDNAIFSVTVAQVRAGVRSQSWTRGPRTAMVIRTPLTAHRERQRLRQEAASHGVQTVGP